MTLPLTRALALLLAALTALAQPLPSSIRTALTGTLKASPENIAQIERGDAAAYLFETGRPDDVLIVGAVRIWTPPAYFVERFRNITEFEAAPSIQGSGKFSTPPVPADLAGLSFSKPEIDDIRDCKPGDCDFKFGERAMSYLRTTPDWSAPNYQEQVNEALRGLSLEYLKEYQSLGNAALPRYHDTKEVFSVEKGLNELLEKTAVLKQYIPEVAAYLRDYPQARLPGAEEFFYWQVGDFGLKPVHRLTHVVMAKGPTQYGQGYVIASKMLFASHYFRTAFELRFLIPGQDQNKGGMHYLLVVQRSYVDGLTGMKGGLLRGTILSRSRQSVENYLKGVKTKVETGFAQKKKG